jgi:hypothetical protein
MTQHRSTARALKTLAGIAITLFGLGALGVVVADELTSESAQAGALVTLGRSALAKGDPAAAVLSFERARLLAPRAFEVRSALSDVGVPALGPWVARTVIWITPREWSSLAVGFGWITVLIMAVAMVRGRKGLLAWLGSLCSAVALVLSMGGVVESNIASRSLGVVTEPTGVRVAPYEAAGATADLRAGSVVVIGARYGDFLQVRGADGVSGWVVSGALRRVVGAGA